MLQSVHHSSPHHQNLTVETNMPFRNGGEHPSKTAIWYLTSAIRALRGWPKVLPMGNSAGAVDVETPRPVVRRSPEQCNFPSWVCQSVPSKWSSKEVPSWMTIQGSAKTIWLWVMAVGHPGWLRVLTHSRIWVHNDWAHWDSGVGRGQPGECHWRVSS